MKTDWFFKTLYPTIHNIFTHLLWHEWSTHPSTRVIPGSTVHWIVLSIPGLVAVPVTSPLSPWQAPIAFSALAPSPPICVEKNASPPSKRLHNEFSSRELPWCHARLRLTKINFSATSTRGRSPVRTSWRRQLIALLQVLLYNEMSFWRSFHHWLHRKLSSGAANDENFIKMTNVIFSSIEGQYSPLQYPIKMHRKISFSLKPTRYLYRFRTHVKFERACYSIDKSVWSICWKEKITEQRKLLSWLCSWQGFSDMAMMTSSNGSFFPRYWPLCAENSQITCEFPSHRASNTDFDVSLMWVCIRC